jgi:ABC-type multidrug transport system permease subunit
MLIFIGLFGLLARYVEIGDWQVTSLIPAFFGIILLPMSKGIKNENPIIAHLAVVVTMILALMVTYMFIKGWSNDFVGSRKFFIFLIVGLASYSAIAIYVAGFIEKKKAK